MILENVKAKQIKQQMKIVKNEKYGEKSVYLFLNEIENKINNTELKFGTYLKMC